MAVSSSTTLAGIQDKLVADVTSIFQKQSTLFNAVDAMDVGDALVAQFHTQTVPSALSAHTEGATVTATTVTLTAVPATLEEYDLLVSLSPISDTPAARQVAARTIAGSLARTIDTEICKIGDDFSAYNAISGEIALSTIFGAKATLDATGYVGEIVCVLHPLSMNKVGLDTLEITNPTSDGAEWMGAGYVGNIGGVKIYQSPWVQADATHSTCKRNFMCFKDAIGLAYRTPLVEVREGWTHTTATNDISAYSMFDAVQVTSGAGVVIYDYNAS